jgi:hypothetical protein
MTHASQTLPAHRSHAPLPHRSLLLSAGHSLYNISISNDSRSPAASVFWMFDASDWVYSSAVVTNDGNILFGSFDQNVYAVSRCSAYTNKHNPPPLPPLRVRLASKLYSALVHSSGNSKPAATCSRKARWTATAPQPTSAAATEACTR